MTSPVRIVALISGGGRTVCNLQNEILKGQVDASIVRVVASREDISGVERTRELGLDVRVPTGPDYGQELAELVDSCKPDLICLCGYLRKLSLRPQWQGGDQHPSVLPQDMVVRMCGRCPQGGHRIQGRLLRLLVHFVDDEYDQGPILLNAVAGSNPATRPRAWQPGCFIRNASLCLRQSA